MEQAAQRPLPVLVGVAADLLGAARLDRGLAQTLRDRLGDHCVAACAALPELTEILGEQRQTAEVGPETFGQVRTVQALAALVDAIGSPQRPALVLLDDCQWADELTLKLLGHWQRRQAADAGFGRHVLLVVAFRSEEVPAGHVLRDLHPALQLELLPFAAEDVRRLLIMARRLFGFMTLMAVVALALGMLLWLGFDDTGRWLMIKLVFVLGLIGYHIACRLLLARMLRGAGMPSSLALRLFNEAALLLVVPIILLAVIKPP